MKQFNFLQELSWVETLGKIRVSIPSLLRSSPNDYDDLNWLEQNLKNSVIFCIDM